MRWSDRVDGLGARQPVLELCLVVRLDQMRKKSEEDVHGGRQALRERARLQCQGVCTHKKRLRLRVQRFVLLLYRFVSITTTANYCTVHCCLFVHSLNNHLMYEH